MKAVRLLEAAGTSSLQVIEVPDPVPGAGEALVRIRYAALNHRDVFITQGLYPRIQLPVTLGSDGCGEVVALGPAVERPAVGDVVVLDPTLGWGNDPRVWERSASILGMPRDGTFAEYVCVPAVNCHPKPPHLRDEEAAALPLAGVTAYRATFTRGALRPGETVLITGVGGGVQTFALLYAKHAGARAIVTSSSDEKLLQAKALGADFGFNYRNADWQKEVAAIGLGLDLVIDSAGGETFVRALQLLKPGGRAVVYGATSGDAHLQMFPVFWRQLDIHGTSMGSPQDFASMLKLFAGALRPVIDEVFPMADVVRAAERMHAGAQFGKIVLAIP